MRSSILTIIYSSTILFSLAAHASESPVKESGPIGSVQQLSKEEVRKGVENGELCIDAKGLANSRGAIIKQNGRRYRCVKAFGEGFNDQKALVWVEVLINKGGAVTAD